MCRRARSTLKGSLVLLSYASGDSVWQVKHPTSGGNHADLFRELGDRSGMSIRGLIVCFRYLVTSCFSTARAEMMM